MRARSRKKRLRRLTQERRASSAYPPRETAAIELLDQTFDEIRKAKLPNKGQIDAWDAVKMLLVVWPKTVESLIGERDLARAEVKAMVKKRRTKVRRIGKR